MTTAEISTDLMRFIAERYLDGVTAEITVDTPLFGLGILDSMTIQEFLSYIETKFAVKIDDGEISPENLETVGAITKLIERGLTGKR
jgi:acyl carrier protein